MTTSEDERDWGFLVTEVVLGVGEEVSKGSGKVTEFEPTRSFGEGCDVSGVYHRQGGGVRWVVSRPWSS